MSSLRPLAAVLAVASLAFPMIPAQAQHFSLEAAVAASEYGAPSGFLGDSAAAFGLLGRYSWASGFGLEAGTRAHGAFSASSASNAKVRVDVTSYLFGANYSLALGRVNLDASLGVHAWRDRGDVYGPGRTWAGRLSDSGSGLYHSLGLSYALGERTTLGIARSEFRVENDAVIRSTDLRLGYRF